MKFLSYLFLKIFILFVGLIPFGMLYAFSDFMRFILYRIIGYRKKVVKDNLKRCFPDLSSSEMEKVVNLSYKNLTDLIIEGIKGFTISKKEVYKRYKILNPEILDPFQEKGKSVILVLGHYGNWEWGGLSAPIYFHYKEFITFYKPLSNSYIDRYIKKNRSRTGGRMSPIHKTAITFKQFVDKPSIFVLVADQSPSNVKKSIWVSFLGQPTAFLHGPEKYATDYNLPVVFVDVQRVKRGYYEIKLNILSENPMNMAPNEITTLYAKKLEEVILKKPENWLWSHKRWKLKPVNEN